MEQFNELLDTSTFDHTEKKEKTFQVENGYKYSLYVSLIINARNHPVKLKNSGYELTFTSLPGRVGSYVCDANRHANNFRVNL